MDAYIGSVKCAFYWFIGSSAVEGEFVKDVTFYEVMGFVNPGRICTCDSLFIEYSKTCVLGKYDFRVAQVDKNC